jgi:hypothetical protein
MAMVMIVGWHPEPLNKSVTPAAAGHTEQIAVPPAPTSAH